MLELLIFSNQLQTQKFQSVHATRCYIHTDFLETVLRTINSNVGTYMYHACNKKNTHQSSFFKRTNRRRNLASETGNKHGGEPDNQVVGECLCFTAGVLCRHRLLVPIGHINSAERTGSLAGREPPVDAVPVEHMATRQSAGSLAEPNLGQADAALVRWAAAVLAGLCCLRSCLDAHDLGNVG